jgi:hypothetical protein
MPPWLVLGISVLSDVRVQFGLPTTPGLSDPNVIYREWMPAMGTLVI